MSAPFIHSEFLLETDIAQRLYHEEAEPEPIFDYHCHLPPADIARNRRFENLFEIWLEGDHYKWRAMRANGVDEELITGSASPKEKFLAWAATVPATLRNPLYHWTHLELQRYFGIDVLLDASTAERVWDEANERLAGDSLTTQGILRRFQVRALCTTDDPADELAHHHDLAVAGFDIPVLPAFRPDQALNIGAPEQWKAWVARLGKAVNREIHTFQNFLDALQQRHDDFDRVGCRLSDHGLDHCFAEQCTEAEAAAYFERAFAGSPASPADRAKFASFLMLFFGRLDAAKGWTKQLHLGAKRSVNTRMLAQVGRDTGYDSIGDWRQVDHLAAYLDALNLENALPKMILYNVNPNDNYTLATMAGNFQEGRGTTKIQFGTAWWFLDQKEGMEWQINALSCCGLLSKFLGMVTDSRSFMSYPRHEYFRRTLCNLIGNDVAKGLLPRSPQLLGPLVRNICFANARDFLGIRVS